MNQRRAKSEVRRSRKALFALITLAIASVGMLLFSELALRLVAPQPRSWFDVYRAHPSLPFYALLPNVDTLIDTGEVRWKLYTDEHGHRVRQPHPKPQPMPPREPWALVLGDSFAFATGVDYELSFPDKLDQKSPLRFVNTSVPGYGPSQYRAILEAQLKPRPPELILVATFLGNDFHDCIWAKDGPVEDGVIGNRGDLRSILKNNTHLYRLLSKLYHAYFPQPTDSVGAPEDTFQPAAWKQGGSLHEASRIYRQEMTRMHELAGDIPMLVIVIPIRESVQAFVGKPAREDFDYARPGRFVTDHLAQLGVPYIDLTPILAKHPLDRVFFPYDGHLTPFGHDVVVQAVTPQLDQLLAKAPQ